MVQTKLSLELFFVCSVLLMCSLNNIAVADQSDQDGFVSLFNGKDLTGWETKGNWLAEENGVVALKPRSGEEGWQRYDAYLMAAKPYHNFVLDFDYKIPPKGNSGVFFRVRDKANPVHTGLEIQILDSHGKKGALTPHDNGGLVGRQAASKNTSKPAGEWNRLIVTCSGERLGAKLNGEQIIDVNIDDPEAQKGKTYIGLQDHGQPIWFRNIRIKQLP
ncbi:MAG: DUF1080 domain-containing protein [Pirellulales bacterium]|nr:DUF1080 domain-containing protein [Pirellulales bacterium]